MTEKGLCKLSVVPVRSKSADTAEICTQLLYGDAYEVIEKTRDGKWLKIRIAYDEYEGWIDFKQHLKVSESYYERLTNESNPQFCVDIASEVMTQTKPLPILLGSVLPLYEEECADLDKEKHYFRGQANSFDRYELHPVALQYLGAPYLWGGKTPFGIDCSGFVQQVFKMCGLKLQRDAYQQERQGFKIPYGDHQLGDLAFFANDSGKVIHVGMVLEDNHIIHAHGEVRIDPLDDKGIFNTDREEYSHYLCSIRRIL